MTSRLLVPRRLPSLLRLLQEGFQADALVLVHPEDLVRRVNLLQRQPLLMQTLLAQCQLQLVYLVCR